MVAAHLPEVRRSLRDQRFVPPTTTLHLVDRRGLRAWLDHILELRLFMVVAPAGFGKTTLLSQFAGRAPALTAWVSLDQLDADPATLILDVFDSIRRHKPNAARRPAEALERERSQGRGAVGSLATLLTEYLAELAEPVIVVLDDYHLAERGDAEGFTERFVSALVRDAALEHLHLVVGSREVPRFPFSRLVLRDRVEGVGQAELAFGTEEVRRYLELVRSQPVDLLEAEQYRRQTEGWPAGIALLNAAPAHKLSLIHI